MARRDLLVCFAFSENIWGNSSPILSSERLYAFNCICAGLQIQHVFMPPPDTDKANSLETAPQVLSLSPFPSFVKFALNLVKSFKPLASVHWNSYY